MSFIKKVLNKYKLNLLIYIFIKEIEYIIKSLDFPLFDIKKKKNKNYHLSISTPYVYMNLLKKVEDIDKKSIFIDFGCGNGRVLKFLNKKKTFDFYYGYELEKKIVNKSKKNLDHNVFIEEKNLEEFCDNDYIFDFIKYQKIEDIYLYFYNPFSIKIVIKILDKFKRFDKFHMFLLGFYTEDLKEIKTEEIKEIYNYFSKTLTILKYEKRTN